MAPRSADGIIHFEKRLALRASSQGCVHEVVSEFRWESPTRTRDICRMYQPYNQE